MRHQLLLMLKNTRHKGIGKEEMMVVEII